MIAIEWIDKVEPELFDDITDCAREEMNGWDIKNFQVMNERWTITNDGETIMLLFLFQASLMGPRPELWIIPTKVLTAFHIDNCTAHLRAITTIYPEVVVCISKDFKAGLKLARYCGFTEFVREEERNDRTVVIYGVN